MCQGGESSALPWRLGWLELLVKRLRPGVGVVDDRVPPQEADVPARVVVTAMGYAACRAAQDKVAEVGAGDVDQAPFVVALAADLHSGVFGRGGCRPAASGHLARCVRLWLRQRTPCPCPGALCTCAPTPRHTRINACPHTHMPRPSDKQRSSPMAWPGPTWGPVIPWQPCSSAGFQDNGV